MIQNFFDIILYDFQFKEKHEISYFLKANALRRTIQEKEDIVKTLDDAISNLEKEKKEFK